MLISSSGSVRKSQDLLGTSIEGYLAIARSDLASEVENRQLRRLSFQLSKILSLSSRSISGSSSRSILVTMQVTIPSGRSSLEVVVEIENNIFCEAGKHIDCNISQSILI